MFQINEKQNIHDISDYSVIDIIGTGSFGTCYKVKHKSSQKFYVWKAVDYGSMSIHEKELLVTEVNLMSTLKHSNIVQYYGRIIHKSSGTLYIIMEWCQCGDLDSLINNCKLQHHRVNEPFVWKVLYQTAKALEACHSLLHQITVLHRDIKPANIFLDENYNVKLGDFGLAKILRNNTHFSSSVVGTPYYMSPEQIRGSKYNKKSDVWSLGCLLYELCCLHQPFSGKDMEELRKNISSNKLPRIPSVYSDYLDKMVKLLLSSNVEFRPSVEMIVHHPTVVCNYNEKAVPFHIIEEKSNTQNEIAIDKKYSSKNAEKTALQSENIESLIKGIEKLSHNIRHYVELDPQKISEDVYNEKLISRLRLLHVRESALKAKEDSLKKKERLLKTKENTLVQKQKQIEKRELEIATLRRTNKKAYSETITAAYNQHRISNMLEYKQHRCEEDLESTTCSADPGDSSMAPTAAKLDLNKIVKPYFFTVKPKRKNSNNQERQRQPLAFLQNHNPAGATVKTLTAVPFNVNSKSNLSFKKS